MKGGYGFPIVMGALVPVSFGAPLFLGILIWMLVIFGLAVGWILVNIEELVKQEEKPPLL